MNTQAKFGIAAIALCTVVSGCTVQTQTPGSSGSAQQQIAQRPAQPTTAKAERRDIVGYRLLNGKVYAPANAIADVFSQGEAPIQTVNVKERDHVRKGQVLVTLATGQQESYEQAKATYDAALASYNQALAQYEQPVKDVARQLAQAKETERNIRQTTPPNGDATSLQQAIATRQALQDQLKVVQSQAQTNELQYKTQLDQAKLALAQARSGVQASTITSPINGTVVSLTVSAGQTVSGHTAIAKIVDLPALKVQSDVDPDDATFVKKGTAVAIVFGDYPDRKFDGRVTKVETLPAEQEGKVEYEATIDFNNTDGLVQPNSTVRSVGVVVGHRRGVIAVPVDAVGKDTSGKPFVKVMQDGAWKPVVVELGMSDGNFVEIRSGVHEDDNVQVVPGQGQWLIGTNLTTTS